MSKGILSQVSLFNLFIQLTANENSSDFENWQKEYMKSLLEEAEESGEPVSIVVDSEDVIRYVLSQHDLSIEEIENLGVEMGETALEEIVDQVLDLVFCTDYDLYISVDVNDVDLILYFEAGSTFRNVRDAFVAIFGDDVDQLTFSFDCENDKGFCLIAAGIADSDEEEEGDDEEEIVTSESEGEESSEESSE